MFSKGQRKYEEEAERLVQVLRRWHDLETEAKRLEWELAQCRKPEDDHPPAPPEARKPALLRRAEAGKSIVPEKKRGIEQSWKNRIKEVSTFREHYEINAQRLAVQVERLAQKLAECNASRVKKAGGGDGRSASPPTADPQGKEKNPYQRMPPALRRMRAQLERVRQEHGPPSPGETTPAAEGQTVEAEVETAAPQVVEQKMPEEAPRPQPPKKEPRRDTGQPWQEKYQTLEREHRALEQAKREVERQLEQMTSQVHAQEKKREDDQAAAETRAQKQTALQQAFEVVHILDRHFRHGQRSFLGQPDAPDVAAELAALVYYALTHLAQGLATGDGTRTRAMYANLYTIARNLQSYKLTTLHGFDAVLDVLQALPGGDAAHYAGQLTRSTQTPGAEAQPLRACLKSMRDKASVELRPFFYDVDAAGEVLTIG